MKKHKKTSLDAILYRQDIEILNEGLRSGKIDLQNLTGHSGEQTAKFIEKMIDRNAVSMGEKHKNRKQTQRAGRKPKKRVAIFELAKRMHLNYPKMTADELWDEIKATHHSEETAYQNGNYNVFYQSGLLIQKDDAAKIDKEKSIKLNTFRNYLTEIRKNLKKTFL
jgi:hypothetical protein